MVCVILASIDLIHCFLLLFANNQPEMYCTSHISVHRVHTLPTGTTVPSWEHLYSALHVLYNLQPNSLQATSLHKDCNSAGEPYDVDQLLLFLCKLWLLDFGFKGPEMHCVGHEHKLKVHVHIIVCF